MHTDIEFAGQCNVTVDQYFCLDGMTTIDRFTDQVMTAWQGNIRKAQLHTSNTGSK